MPVRVFPIGDGPDSILRVHDEVAYWRKCWNVRRAIFEALGQSSNSDQYEFDISSEALHKIIIKLKHFNKRNWDASHDDSIWEWNEIKGHLRKQITMLSRIERVLRKDPEAIKLMFYDSY